MNNDIGSGCSLDKHPVQKHTCAAALTVPVHKNSLRPDSFVVVFHVEFLACRNHFVPPTLHLLLQPLAKPELLKHPLASPECSRKALA